MPRKLLCHNQSRHGRATSIGSTWGWALAVVVIVGGNRDLGTALTHAFEDVAGRSGAAGHQELGHRLQTGDLTALRSLTCGSTRDGYGSYDERDWAGNLSPGFRRPKQYPVIASIDGRRQLGARTPGQCHHFRVRSPGPLEPAASTTVSRRQWKICQSLSS